MSSDGEESCTSVMQEPPKITDLRKFTNEQVKLMKPLENAEKPFKDMKISDASFLDELDGRSLCSLCNKSRKYFCYTCHIPLPTIAEKIPKLELPCEVVVIKHPREIDGKSTAIHAAVVAPDHTKVHTYPDIPDFAGDPDTVLVFPGKNALTLEEILRTCKKGSKETKGESVEPQVKKARQDVPFTRAIFIDCTWNQTKRIYNDERLKGLRSIELKSRDTLFWRYQRGKPRTYLATIEAIYYFVVDFHTQILGQQYHGQFDDLLFFFKFMFDKIHTLYDPQTLRAYKDV